MTGRIFGLEYPPHHLWVSGFGCLGVWGGLKKVWGVGRLDVWAFGDWVFGVWVFGVRGSGVWKIF